MDYPVDALVCTSVPEGRSTGIQRRAQAGFYDVALRHRESSSWFGLMAFARSSIAEERVRGCAHDSARQCRMLLSMRANGRWAGRWNQNWPAAKHLSDEEQIPASDRSSAARACNIPGVYCSHAAGRRHSRNGTRDVHHGDGNILARQVRPWPEIPVPCNSTAELSGREIPENAA
jgi:hypothetical protein